jgi:hypothetical protein
VYCNGKVITCDNNKVIVNAVITTPTIKQYIRAENSSEEKKFSYNYKTDSMNIQYHKNIVLQNSSQISTVFMIKNEMMSFESEHYDMLSGNYKHSVTTMCDFTDSTTGLRRRGKFSSQSMNDKKTTIHTIDGKIVRKERDGKVIVDKLSEKKLTTFLIGWKVCKNAEGHFRIVKLKIPESAQYLMAIDEEFFMCYRKHRSDIAEVLDIQLPLFNEEVSVADTEREAYSCVYNDNSLTYKINSTVTSEYDSDENNGCAKGIHWYKERKYAFRHIPEYHDKIACKHD